LTDWFLAHSQSQPNLLVSSRLQVLLTRLHVTAHCHSMLAQLYHITSECHTLQDADNNWAFDIFGYSDATPGYSLSLLVWHFVTRAGLMKDLSIDEARFCAFARRIEAGYNPSNPYHNRSGSMLVIALPGNCMMVFHDTEWKKKRAAQARAG